MLWCACREENLSRRGPAYMDLILLSLLFAGPHGQQGEDDALCRRALIQYVSESRDGSYGRSALDGLFDSGHSSSNSNINSSSNSRSGNGSESSFRSSDNSSQSAQAVLIQRLSAHVEARFGPMRTKCLPNVLQMLRARAHANGWWSAFVQEIDD